jgi:hypothetical protein
MTHLNPTLHRTNPFPRPHARSLIGGSRLCLRLLVSIPVAIAKGVMTLSCAIGNAVEMAYVDPFMPNRKDRK